MRRIALLLLPLALAACQDDLSTPEPLAFGSGDLIQLSMSSAGEQIMPGQVVVRVREDSDPATVASAHGLTVAERGYQGAFTVMRGAVGNERALAARLGADTRVVYAEPNYLRQPHTDLSKLWAFYNPGGLAIRYTQGRNSGQVVASFRSTADADEDAAGPDVPTNYGAGGTAVVIGSIDTGVDFSHPELAGRLIAGCDWIGNTTGSTCTDVTPHDEDNHGTHTSGTMAGTTVGVAGVAGAAPNVRVYVQRVCGPRGCPLSAIANAIRAAADVEGMVAMNLSLGGSSLSQGEADAIAYATGKGVLVIASAGNGNTGTVSCPACDPNAISVAATNWQDERAYYSNWGPGLDLSAPGGQLYSNTSQEGGIWSAVRGGGYAYYQGTSMAAPQVTGTAAVVASKTGLRGAALRSRLESTADDIGAPGYDETFGHGRLNTHRAVTASTGGGGNGGGGGTALSASAGKSCSNATCTFTGSASGGTGPYTYTWADGQWSASGQTVTRIFTQAGNYTITLTVGDAAGGEAPAQTSVSCSVRGKNLKCQ